MEAKSAEHTMHGHTNSIYAHRHEFGISNPTLTSRCQLMESCAWVMEGCVSLIRPNVTSQPICLMKAISKLRGSCGWLLFKEAKKCFYGNGGEFVQTRKVKWLCTTDDRWCVLICPAVSCWHKWEQWEGRVGIIPQYLLLQPSRTLLLALAGEPPSTHAHTRTRTNKYTIRPTMKS